MTKKAIIFAMLALLSIPGARASATEAAEVKSNDGQAQYAAIPEPQELIEEVLLPELRSCIATEARQWLSERGGMPALSQVQEDKEQLLTDKASALIVPSPN